LDQPYGGDAVDLVVVDLPVSSHCSLNRRMLRIYRGRRELSAPLCASPVMRFLFQCRDDVLEALNVGGGHMANHCSFEIGQMVVDSLRQSSPLYCQ